MYKKIKTSDFASVAEAILFDFNTHKENRRLVMADLKAAYALVKSDKKLAKEAKVDYLEAKVLHNVAKKIYKKAKSILGPYIKGILLGQIISVEEIMPKKAKKDKNKKKDKSIDKIFPDKILVSKKQKQSKNLSPAETTVQTIIENIASPNKPIAKTKTAVRTPKVTAPKTPAKPRVTKSVVDKVEIVAAPTKPTKTAKVIAPKITDKPVVKKAASTPAKKVVADKTTTKVPPTAKQPKLTPAKTKTTELKSDDLKKIEGIGPKIEQLLHADGIISYKELATADVAKIQAILNKAGNRYKMHNPATWQEQATLANNGDWESLKVLQDALNGGKR